MEDLEILATKAVVRRISHHERIKWDYDKLLAETPEICAKHHDGDACLKDVSFQAFHAEFVPWGALFNKDKESCHTFLLNFFKENSTLTRTMDFFSPSDVQRAAIFYEKLCCVPKDEFQSINSGIIPDDCTLFKPPLLCPWSYLHCSPRYCSWDALVKLVDTHLGLFACF